MTSKPVHIFCDFDGTVAANDVGHLLFSRFAGPACAEVVQEWKDGKISSLECYLREFELARVTPEELEAFVAEQELDPHFPEFVAFARRRGIDVEIASDGFDFYIERILRNHALADIVEYRSNVLTFVGADRIAPSFPYSGHSCGRCANCKGYHVRQASAAGYSVVYVGDGLSDRCGAEAADYVFAKRGRDLLPFCRSHDIACFEYNDFSDVTSQMRTMLDNGYLAGETDGSDLEIE